MDLRLLQKFTSRNDEVSYEYAGVRVTTPAESTFFPSGLVIGDKYGIAPRVEITIARHLYHVIRNYLKKGYNVYCAAKAEHDPDDLDGDFNTLETEVRILITDFPDLPEGTSATVYFNIVIPRESGEPSVVTVTNSLDEATGTVIQQFLPWDYAVFPKPKS